MYAVGSSYHGIINRTTSGPLLLSLTAKAAIRGMWGGDGVIDSAVALFSSIAHIIALFLTSLGLVPTSFWLRQDGLTTSSAGERRHRPAYRLEIYRVEIGRFSSNRSAITGDSGAPDHLERHHQHRAPHNHSAKITPLRYLAYRQQTPRILCSLRRSMHCKRSRSSCGDVHGQWFVAARSISLTESMPELRAARRFATFLTSSMPIGHIVDAWRLRCPAARCAVTMALRNQSCLNWLITATPIRRQRSRQVFRRIVKTRTGWATCRYRSIKLIHLLSIIPPLAQPDIRPAVSALPFR